MRSDKLKKLKIHWQPNAVNPLNGAASELTLSVHGRHYYVNLGPTPATSMR